ncbi:MAG: peptidylprolyl isomerase [Planctomycetota bacterium]
MKTQLPRLGVATRPSLLAAIVSLALGAHALGQVTPDRLYYGIDREVPMTVKIPDAKKGDAAIQLLEPSTFKVLATAPVTAGAVNLATLFPTIWTEKSPKLAYAQLVVGTEPVGPAVVLQPMTSQPRAQIIYTEPRQPHDQGRLVWSEVPDVAKIYSGIRAYVDKHIVMDTTLGSIEIELRPDVAPNTAWSFRHLAEGGFYTDIKIHRIAKNNGQGHPFVIQAGDPNGSGAGGPGFNIDLEKSNLPHDFGIVSMARTNSPDTGGSQFFICLSREGTAFLDGPYCSFAQCVSGADTISKLATVDTLPRSDTPVNAPKIKSAKLVDAPPYGKGPKTVTKPNAEKPTER